MKRFDIAIALIWRDGKVLVTKRRDDADHLPGLWEFPGGKCHEDEPPEACAIREAREEVGVEVETTGPHPPIEFTYPERHVTLHPFDCTIIAGEPQPLQAAALRWLTPDELRPDEFPLANRELIAEIKRAAGNR